MSVTKIYLQDLKELKEQYKNDPESFKRKMTKADVLIGPTNSMKFVEKIIKN